jgi:HSP20 family protein
MEHHVTNPDGAARSTNGEHVATAVAPVRRKAFRPRCDVRETEHAFELVADVPGADEAALELSCERGMLSLRAPISEPRFAGASLVAAEYQEGDWTLRFALDAEIDAERVTARLHDGVLRVTLPKSQGTRASARRIPVRTER